MYYVFKYYKAIEVGSICEFIDENSVKKYFISLTFSLPRTDRRIGLFGTRKK